MHIRQPLCANIKLTRLSLYGPSSVKVGHPCPNEDLFPHVSWRCKKSNRYLWLGSF